MPGISTFFKAGQPKNVLKPITASLVPFAKVTVSSLEHLAKTTSPFQSTPILVSVEGSDTVLSFPLSKKAP